MASTLFMFVAGLEMDLDKTMAQKHKPLIVGLCSVIFPFAWGFGVTWANPAAMGATPKADHEVYAFFAGTAMAITAMPVVAKTLRDVGLYRAEIGQVVMASATVDDLIGWSLFAVVLSMANPEKNMLPISTGAMIAVSITYVVFMVVFGRMVFDRFFLWIQATFSYPGGVLGFVIAWTYVSASLGTLFNLHYTIGGFVVGASMSNNKYLRSATRELLDDFICYCIAPIFFGFIAVGGDFIGDFDIALVAVVLVIACIGKFMGASLGARLTGNSWRESFALATCMNSRGAMEILLANVALSAGIIDGRMFVALIFMAIVTSLLPGPVLRLILKRKERKVFSAYMPNPSGFIPELKGTNVEAVVREMCAALKEPEAAELLIQQEQLLPSGNHDQLAVSWMNLDSARRTKICVALSKPGIDFSGQLGEPGNNPHVANIVVVVLFPPKIKLAKDVTLENDLIQQICLVFGRQAFRNEFMQATRFLEVLNLINVETHRQGLHSTQEEALHARRHSNPLILPLSETPPRGASSDSDKGLGGTKAADELDAKERQETPERGARPSPLLSTDQFQAGVPPQPLGSPRVAAEVSSFGPIIASPRVSQRAPDGTSPTGGLQRRNSHQIALV
jgi:Kef-type K+ transport system membrane component KefB